MTVPAKDPVTMIRKSSSSDESLKTTFQGGFFVSGQEITLDPQRSSSAHLPVHALNSLFSQTTNSENLSFLLSAQVKLTALAVPPPWKVRSVS